MAVDRHIILHAYRQLYRSGLRAVQYSRPARYTLKSRIDHAFRNGTPADLDAQRIGNTISFLQSAAKEKGMEHKILKNLLFVRFWQDKNIQHQTKYDSNHWNALGVNTSVTDFWASPNFVSFKQSNIRKTAFHHFDITVKMLNESMGMCLR